jgi:hypothetical protein
VEFAVICELEATSTSWKKGLGLTVAHPTATALWVLFLTPNFGSCVIYMDVSGGAHCLLN